MTGGVSHGKKAETETSEKAPAKKGPVHSERETYGHPPYRHHIYHSTEGHVCAVKDGKIADVICAALNKKFAGEIYPSTEIW